MSLRDEILSECYEGDRLHVMDAYWNPVVSIAQVNRKPLTRIAEDRKTVLYGERDDGRLFSFGVQRADGKIIYPMTLDDPLDMGYGPYSWDTCWAHMRAVLACGWKVDASGCAVEGDDAFKANWVKLDETSIWMLRYLYEIRGCRPKDVIHSEATRHHAENWLTELGIPAQSGEDVKTISSCIAGWKWWDLADDLHTKRNVDGGPAGWHELRQLSYDFMYRGKGIARQIALFRRRKIWTSRALIFRREVSPHNFHRLVKQDAA